MNKNFSLLLAAGALAAFLVNPLIAGHRNAHDDKIIYLKSGDMIIPMHGEGGGEETISWGQLLADEDDIPIFYPQSDIYPEGQPIGLRRMLLGVTAIIQIPLFTATDQ